MGLWLMGRLPAHIMTHNEKTRRSGSSDKSNSGGIATQHHRCNGKSFQCPFNVTVLCDHTLLWASTCSVVLVLAIMLGAAPGATRKPRMCSFLPKCSATEHRHALHERSCDYRTGSMFVSVRITAARRVAPPSRGPSCAAIVHRRPPCRPTPPPIRTPNSTRAHMPSDYRDGTELSTRPIPPADSGRPIAQPCPQRDSLCKQRLNSCVFACAAIVVILK